MNLFFEILRCSVALVVVTLALAGIYFSPSNADRSPSNVQVVSANNPEVGSDVVDSNRFAEDWKAFEAPLQKNVLNILDEILVSKQSIISINKSTTHLNTIVVLVHGLDFEKNLSVWKGPIALLIQKDIETYFAKWSKRRSLQENAQILRQELLNLHQESPQKKILVLGHSAGGIVALLSLDQMIGQVPEKDLANFHFYTAAAPIFGYAQKNPFEKAVSWLIGRSTMQIGAGVFQLFQHKKMDHCTNWVNTNCKLDKHACEWSGINPQTGPVSAPYEQLPCVNSGGLVKVESTHNAIMSDLVQKIGSSYVDQSL